MGQPLGISFFRYLNCFNFTATSRVGRRRFYQFLALLLTFLCYGTLHLARKPPSVVKSTLSPSNTTANSTNAGWDPFNGDSGDGLLGNVDTAFLGAYAAGMFFSGAIADRVSLRYFLTFGMLTTGLFTALFGLAQTWNVHQLWYFFLMQILAGVFQSIGWPSVVAVVGNWFGRGQRGFIMGVWNSHTSIGNIIGSVVCSSVLGYGWGWSFIVPGILCGAVGLILFLFLVETPEDVGLLSADDQKRLDAQEAAKAGSLQDPSDMQAANEAAQLFDNKLKDLESKKPLGRKHGSSDEGSKQPEAINFFRALLIPGVATYSVSLFFCKLVSYTFMFWLPKYLSITPVDGVTLSDSDAGFLSTLFDVGGIIGGIVIGLIADYTRRPASISVAFLFASVPCLYAYRVYGPDSSANNLGLMILAGIAVQGPYSLITTAVSSDLGTHESLKGNSQALATVTAIIDGTGSIGAAIGPSIAGWLSNSNDPSSWDLIFWLMMGMDAFSGLLLFGLVYKEIVAYLRKRSGFAEIKDDQYGAFRQTTPVIHRVASVY